MYMKVNNDMINKPYVYNTMMLKWMMDVMKGNIKDHEMGWWLE